jgi:hypothetical protein
VERQLGRLARKRNSRWCRVVLRHEPIIATFRKALGETGFIEGQNVRIEYRWADEQYDRLPALANQLVRDQVALGKLLVAQAA